MKQGDICLEVTVRFWLYVCAYTVYVFMPANNLKNKVA